jgi:uncharacterized lipoprotein
MKHWILAAALLALGTTACATVPVRREFERSVTIRGSTFDKVWADLIDLFEERDWQILDMDIASGSVNTDWMTVENAKKYYDCGNPGVMTDSNHMGRFNVVVRGEEATRVTINTSWRANRAFRSGGSIVNCASTGVLEKELHAELKRRLGVS